MREAIDHDDSVKILRERILGGISHACRLIVPDLLNRNADILEYHIQRFAVVAEGNRSVMREVLLDQNVAVNLPISLIAKTPMDPKDLVATGSTSPSAI